MLFAAADGEVQGFAAGEISSRKLETQGPKGGPGIRRRRGLITGNRYDICDCQTIRQTRSNREWNAAWKKGDSRKHVAEIGVGRVDSVVTAGYVPAFGSKTIGIKCQGGDVSRPDITHRY